MAIPITRQNAKELVEQIAIDHGYIGEEKMQMVPPDVRRDIELAFLKKDLMIGSSVITLAKNLYTSKARFVFELLQNAADNEYSKDVEPYVSFRVYPHQIIIECNENGFNSDNLAAICEVGKSSKSGAQRYIGEKGIGFKSVFMAAWKVHIQSGYFSFSFRHRTGDSGMGMISPIWEDTEEELARPLTRITLHLQQTGDADTLQKTRESIRQQFEELQETILLFMKKLKKVHVEFYDDDAERTTTVTYSKEEPRVNYAVLKRTKTTDGKAEEHVKCFHVTTHEATNLAKNENRTYTERENLSRAYSKSPVILAFPLSEASIPIIEPQDLFVFLPVRAVGFNFLIQADFVTDASRQDVVKDSLRNHDLLDGIAQAFVEAVLQFCEHDTLRYQWMRYLPNKKDPNWGTLWLSLVNKIADRLAITPVVYGRKGACPRLIKDLLRITHDALDEDGEYLFSDGIPGKVISRDYLASDLGQLADYGLEKANIDYHIQWLKIDLAIGCHSKMKSSHTKDSWHTRAAQLLHLPFENKWTVCTAKLKELTLLPLVDGTWVSASSGPVYFAEVNGLDIPLDIGFRLLSRDITNPHRKSLFKNLGVTTAPERLVQKQILQLYAKAPTDLSLEKSKRHLRFLYLTQDLAKDDEAGNSNLVTYTDNGTFENPRCSWVYIANDEPYGPRELFKKTDPGPSPGDGAPGYSIRFANEAYFANPPVSFKDQKLTWVNWFCEQLGVKRIPNFSEAQLELEYLAEYRPEKFLGAVRAFGHGHCLGNVDVDGDTIKWLLETKVLCRGNRKIPLEETYFPTTQLERRVLQFVEENAFFPWLLLETESPAPHDTIPSEWQGMLTDLQVGYPSSDLDFALDMLKNSRDAFLTEISAASRVRLFNLYEHIHNKYREHANREEARRKVNAVFSESKCIYIPLDNNRYKLAAPEECVWHAAQEMQTRFALQILYEPFFRSNNIESMYIASLFKDTLGIPDSTWEIYVDELKALKATGCEDHDSMTTIYKALNGLRSEIITTDMAKAAFEDNALIYLPSDDGPAWHKVSQCVWSTAARLKGKISLNDEYEGLKRLFVDLLGVKPVDLGMAIDELKELGGRRSTSINELKETIWTVNSLLSTESKLPSPARIIASDVFPVKQPSGDVVRRSLKTEFFVGDRNKPREAFQDKMKFLDFSLREVVSLKPFLDWTGLKDRYVSLHVKEITSFGGEETRLVIHPDRQIHNRAHALLRVATHYQSPRTRFQRDSENFYTILRNVKVYETDGISSDLKLSQDGTSHVVHGESSTLHLREDESGLKIYLPRDTAQKAKQHYSFNQKLPQRLFEWMMSASHTQITEVISQEGINDTKTMINASRSMIKTALEDNGIAPTDVTEIDEEVLGGPERPATPRPSSQQGSESPSSSTQDDIDQEILGTPASSVATPPLNRYRRSTPFADSVFTPSRPSLAPRESLALSAPFSSSSSLATSPPPGASNRQYVSLLEKVINVARRSTFPDHGSLDMSQLQAYLPDASTTTDFGLRSTSQIERDCKVGAAGELFVFELLSHISPQLPEFSRGNWQSTVRKYASVHPEYVDMEPWSGRETADITYADSAGVLTAFLVTKGYLSQSDWAGKTPKFFIEVKATTLACETPLYMSKAQYQRMQDNQLGPENRDTIYVIFRVYHLGRDDMRFQVYLDPETLRLENKLEFTAEKWSVVPGSAE